MKIDLHNHSKYSDGALSVKELLNIAKEKKIDIILTKSVSRFARNTVDLLKVVRRLKELGLEV